MSSNIKCLVMTSEMKELHNQFSTKEGSLRIAPVFKTIVATWQQYNNTDRYPTKEELVRHIARYNGEGILSKEDSKEIKAIDIWADSNSILGNLAIRPFAFSVIEGKEDKFNSVEQAYQYSKAYAALEGATPEQEALIGSIMADLLNASPKKARELGKKIPMNETALEIWNKTKAEDMKLLIRVSFKQNPKAIQALLKTGTAVLTNKNANTEEQRITLNALEEVRKEFQQQGIQIEDSDEDQSPIRDVLEEEKKEKGAESKTEPSKVTDFHKVDAVMFSSQKRNRITLINRLFHEEVKDIIEETKNRLNEELAKAEDIKEKLDIAMAIKNLRPYIAIKQEGPNKIYARVKEIFEDYLEMIEKDREYYINRELEKFFSGGKFTNKPEALRRKLAENRINYRKKQYEQVLEYWDDLIKDAADNYGTDWGVIIDFSNNKIEEDNNNPFVDDEGNNPSEEMQSEREESNYKEGYLINVREVSAFEGASIALRMAIGQIKRTDWEGKDIVDDLGFPQYLQQSYVFAELITALKDMTDASQMLPLLEKLQAKKPWASQIVNAVKNDDKLFTAFYKVFRKDYLNMWVQTAKLNKDGSTSFKTTRINRAAGLSHYFDEWRDNIEYGNVLHEDSIYDNNGHIKIAKAVKGAKLVDEIQSKVISADTKELKQAAALSNIKGIHDLLLMLGINITEDVLKETLERNIDVTDALKQLPAEALLSALDTIYRTMPKNKAVKDGESADLINLYGSAFNKLAFAINRVEEDELESSVRQGKKTLYAHTRPSYLTTLIKKLKGPNRAQLLNELREVDFLYDKNEGRWLNSVYASLDSDDSEEAVKKLEHCVVLEHNKKEYAKWSPLDVLLTLYNQFDSEPQGNSGEGYAFYAVPVLSAIQSAEFIKLKRYNRGKNGASVLDIISDKFVDVIRQEYNRIVTVKQRTNTSNKKIPNYDMTKNKEGGARFFFLPELNSSSFSNNGLSFFEQLAAVADDVDAFNTLARNAARTILETGFEEALLAWNEVGAFTKAENSKAFKYFKVKNNDAQMLREQLATFYYNTMYAQAQIIQMLGVDLAYFKNYADFVKRSLAFHGQTDKINTLAKWDGKYVLADSNGVVRPERSMYLSDDVRPSRHIKEVEEIIDARIKKGELTLADKAVILDKWKNTNVTDAQAIRTLKSFRAVQIAADMWSDSSERAYNNIRNGTWTARDFVELWNTTKPYLYTQTNQSDGVGGTLRVPTIHKNSELVGLTEAIFGAILSKSSKLKGVMDFMEANDIDVVMFSSAVKVGGQAPINVNDAQSIEEVTAILSKAVLDSEGNINKEVVHELDWNDYGIQVATPEHGVGASILVGTQIRRLIGADISPDAVIEIGGKSLTREQWRAYFNAINTANIKADFEKLDKTFSDPKKISEILISEIKNNSRYSNDLIEAVSLDENGQFNIPLFDPAQSQKVQELLNSIIRSRVAKQKIAGGALIQATSWCLNEEDKPQIVWGTDSKGNKRIKYIEAYIPCPDERLYSMLLEPDGSINIDKKDSGGNYILSEKYREVVGFRIPTEAKYSMIPIKVKGFLPRQVGSVIILPDEITTITGSDFDVDKIYAMYHTLNIEPVYDFKAALDAFYDAHPEFVVRGKARKLEGPVKDKFNEFYAQYKEKFYVRDVVTADEFDTGDVDFNSNTLAKDLFEQAKNNNSKRQRDSAMIDLMWSVLTNSDTVDQIVNPGNFDELKRVARIMGLLENMSISDIENTFGSVDKALNLTLEEAEKALDKYGKIVNPLSPATWIDSHQKNMAGAGLVPLAAVQNVSHAITQLSKEFGIAEKYAYTFNGRRRTSLHDIRSIDNKLISRNVGECLTAFVDNGKDPVAGDLNVNEVTQAVAFLLLRLGYSQRTMGLVLKQPAVKKVMRYIGTGKYTFLDAVDAAFLDYKKQRGNNSPFDYGGRTIEHNFTDIELAEAIAAEKNANDLSSPYVAEADFANSQLRILVMLRDMSKAASALSDVVRAVRADSLSGNVGGIIAKSIEQLTKTNDILAQSIMADYPLRGLSFLVDYSYSSTDEEILNSPIATQIAFNRYCMRASIEWLSKLFPQASAACADLHSLAKKFTTYNNLDADTLNKMDSQFLSYLMSGNSKDFTSTQEERDYYINQFPMEFMAFKKENSHLEDQIPLLKRLKVNYSNTYHTSPTIVFNNVGKVTEPQSEQYRSDLRNLLLNEETRELAGKLLKYCYYRGLYYRKDSFTNILPTLLKMSNVTDYVPALRNVHENMHRITQEELILFIQQYIRNNLKDRRFVPEVSESGIFQDVAPDSFAVIVEKGSSSALKAFTYKTEDSDAVRYRDFVCYTFNGKENYYMYDAESSSYKRITPLGNSAYQEYEAGNYNIESVIKEAAIRVTRDKNGNLKTPYSYNEDRASDAFEASMNNDMAESALKTDLFTEDMSIPLSMLEATREEIHDYQRDAIDEDMFWDESLYTNPSVDEQNNAKLNNIERSETDQEGNKPCN